MLYLDLTYALYQVLERSLLVNEHAEATFMQKWVGDAERPKVPGPGYMLLGQSIRLLAFPSIFDLSHFSSSWGLGFCFCLKIVGLQYSTEMTQVD